MSRITSYIIILYFILNINQAHFPMITPLFPYKNSIRIIWHFSNPILLSFYYRSFQDNFFHNSPFYLTLHGTARQKTPRRSCLVVMRFPTGGGMDTACRMTNPRTRYTPGQSTGITRSHLRISS